MDEIIWGGTNDDGTVWLGIVGIRPTVDGLIKQLVEDLPNLIIDKFDNFEFM